MYTKLIRRFRLSTLLILALLLATACAPIEPRTEADTAAPNTGVAETSAPPTVTFIATEYAYEGPLAVAAGVTRLTIDNQGQAPHDISVVKLGEDRALEDFMGLMQQLAGGEEVAIPDWVIFYGGAYADPGQVSSYVVDLTPGEYVVYSFGMDEQGVPDVAKGMVQPLRVTAEEASTAQLPDYDRTLEFVDFSFVIDGELVAGENQVRAINNGAEPHEMIFFRLNEGASVSDLMAFMQGEGPGGPPPFVPVGGIAPITAGVETYTTLHLEPGNYAVICFLPSGMNEGMPHFMLGMIQELVVQ